MILSYYFVFIIFSLIQNSQSLQSGYTCETSVSLSCPETTKVAILEVTYSSECPSTNDENNGGAIYAPSRCIGYNRERVNALCNGQRTCTIDNSLEQRPSFLIGQLANCEFTGQSINIEYSCVPEFYSSKLPRIDICSLESLHGLAEGFIHSPNYPHGYPNSQTCSKTVPSPAAGHRLKIFTLDLDIEGLSLLRFFGIKRINDWLQINNSGEKMFGTRAPFTLLFDDVIEASLMFKSDFANTKRPYKGFLLYFIVTPIRGTRTSTTSTTSTTESPSTISPALLVIRSNDDDRAIRSKTAALASNDRQSNNVGLTLLVVLLSGVLFVIACAFLLYKRRNDRRVRYLTAMFNSFFPTRSTPVTLNTTDNSDETTLNNTVQSKLDFSMANNDEKFPKTNDYNEKFLQTPTLKHVNVNEKRGSQEKQVFIDNLKTCPSPYASHRRSEHKFNPKEQITNGTDLNSNIYSEDPLSVMNSSEKHNNNNNSLFYEYVDLHPRQQPNEEPKEEVIYDVINTNNERAIPQETDYDSVMYATPKNNV